MRFSRKAVLVLSLLTVCFFALGSAYAGNYPSRPITLICPWDAGGGSDAVARMLATLLQDELKVRVNVDNRTGGSGVVGHTAMATAKPDGYTIGLCTTSITMSHWAGLTKLTYKDMVPVALVNIEYGAVNVRSDAPWQDIKEFANAIKANPQKYKGSGAGVGGLWHLAMAGWLKSMDLPIDAVEWIPSKGSAPGLQDMLAGGVDVVTCALPEAATLIDAEKVRPLASMAEKREAKYPDVPTLRESGYNWTCGGFRGIMAPAGTKPEVVDVLERALKNICQGEKYAELMGKRGFGVAWMGSAEYTEKLTQWDKDNGEIMTAVGIAK